MPNTCVNCLYLYEEIERLTEELAVMYDAYENPYNDPNQLTLWEEEAE